MSFKGGLQSKLFTTRTRERLDITMNNLVLFNTEQGSKTFTTYITRKWSLTSMHVFMLHQCLVCRECFSTFLAFFITVLGLYAFFFNINTLFVASQNSILAVK